MTQSAPLMRVRNWDELYENNRSREITRAAWFAAPNDLSGDGYVELVVHPDGAAHLGVWYAVLMLASKAKPRRGLLVKDHGQPHTAASIARVTRLTEAVVSDALVRLLKIGLLEVAEHMPREDNESSSHPGAGNPQEPASKPQNSAAEGKGTEHHHQEGKRKRKEQKRTEPDGTEGAREKSTTEAFDSQSDSRAAFPPKGDDEPKHLEGLYASPEDELKAIYQLKAGEPITLQVLGSIRANLELTLVDIREFVAEVRKHVKGDWRNPAGFLLDLSKRFVVKTKPASRPKTAAENYKCRSCFSNRPGEGAVPDSAGGFTPCSCASPEWIERQKAPGGLFHQKVPNTP
jgi:hypothetical protein